MSKKEENKDDIVIEEELSGADQLKKIREKLKKCQTERQEYLDGWQRAKADYLNIKKNESDNREKAKLFANESLITEIISVLDSFGMAFSDQNSWEKVDKVWRSGVENIHLQLESILRKNGLEKIGNRGEEFNPDIHEAVGGEEGDDNKVIRVIRAGYKLNGVTIRPAEVIIGLKKSN